MLCRDLFIATSCASPRHDRAKMENFNHGRKRGHYKHSHVVVMNKYVIGGRYRAYPRNSSIVRYRNIPYYYGEGCYFVRNNSEYEIVRPPLGIIVNFIPTGMQVINDGRGSLILYNKILYKQISTRDGWKYRVVGYRD